MYRVSAERRFWASHSLRGYLGGEDEPLHAHDWRARVSVVAEDLDAAGLAVDFHRLEEALEALLAPFVGKSLNAVPPFDRENPTAENLARYLYRGLRPSLAPSGVCLEAVTVWEAAGCSVTYQEP